MPNSNPRITIAQVRDLPPAQQNEWWASLSAEEANAYLHNWQFLARDEQLPPDGIWTHWLYLAGRGAGKTRTGAETARQKVKDGCKRLGLIAPTASDARDVMVEGEALAIDTIIPTPDGWKTIEELELGDEVYTQSGKPTLVIAKSETHHNLPCFEVHAKNAEPITASGNHRWPIYLYRQKQTTILRTDEMTVIKRDDRHRYIIPDYKPIETPPLELPMPPYLFGLAYAAQGPLRLQPRSREIIAHVQDLADQGLCEPLETDGTHLLLPKPPPSIPYLRASYQQRIDVVQGMVDARGFIDPDGRCFVVVEKFRVIEYFRDLLYTLAAKPSNTLETDRGLEVSFQPKFLASRIERNLSQMKDLASHRSAITRVTPTASVPVQCIEVADPSNIFLAGRAFIPTHNSGILATAWDNDYDARGEHMGKPIYEPSKRRLTWANGAIATTYSADEPERLRGPQHDYIWCDELCLVADTEVATSLSTTTPIHALKPGDLVQTRQGPKPVLRSWMTGIRPVYKLTTSSYNTLTGTQGHPVLTGTGFKNIIDLTLDDSVRLLNKDYSRIIKLELLPPARVYNIEVEGEHEYFANGILTHNCSWRRPETWDLAMFGLRLGANPQAFISTTPKPRKLIIELMNDPHCSVTKGSTYDNRANLAKNFFQTVITKYEGTRLGMQELMGVLLEESEGALWSREILDKTRRKDFNFNTHAVRVVVAVDPAVSSNKESNECGIVVCAIDAGGHAYVIADISGVFMPAEWAKKAVQAFKYFKADRIIAEGNQGGEMVRHTIHTEDMTVPVKIVHASRGKAARAEPVSALFEQDRAHMVGNCSDLEDQLCTWEPLSGLGSPDRLDAMVWGITELTLGKGFCGEGKMVGAY